ncbi:MAG: GSCFA domain-containing protein [Tabrizicola sp.]|jgi:hypothetical protein|nr:GSCFA domain-containing protein [Tabrizicola sp.]
MSQADGTASPYDGLDPRAYWRLGVAEAGVYPPPDLYRPKFPLTRDLAIMTAGSCFAQHVGAALRKSNYNVIDEEPAPNGVPVEIARSFGYGMYSARYGNIYTTRQLRQLVLEAQGAFVPADAIWEKGDSFFDALRPGVEPEGLPSRELVAEARSYHLRAVARAMARTDVLVFTLGLTEAWEHVDSGTVYPTAPGTIAGKMSDAYRFVNFRHAEIRADFEAVRASFRALNPGVRFLLTVSPVPLTATASGDHVMAATVYSKSVLRAVAGELREDYDDVDYFPSYEIVTAPISAGRMYEKNFRSVRSDAVAKVMSVFLSATAAPAAPGPKSKSEVAMFRARRRAKRLAQANAQPTQAATPADDIICEEQLLDAFARP